MALGEGPPKESLRGGTAGENGEDVTGGQMPLAPSSGTLRLWADVATGIDKSQTVVWKNAVDSLRDALDHLTSSEEARTFVEKYMRPVISILLEQQPSKIGQMERGCVEESLRLAVMIVATDLKAKADAASGNCELLEVLSMVFNKKRIYYRGSKSSWNTHASGLPEVRMQMIHKFRNTKGFAALATYLSSRVSTPNFPPLESALHCILHATAEAIPPNFTKEQAAKVRVWEEDAIRIARAVMDTTGNATEEALKRQTHDGLNQTLTDLHVIFNRLASSRRKELYSFFRFWRGMVLKLITSQSLPLKLFGWEQMNAVIYESRAMRPPPRTFIVSGGGCGFVNGRYDYAGAVTEEGYSKPGQETSYQLQIPESVSENEGGGKKLTLFRCTMRSQQKWWFLSEADEEQPGTDKDVDYYQHKSNKKEEATPPLSGWVTCRSAGVEPPPTLESSGIVVPRGEEYNTLEHQLAKWALENNLIELVLGDSVHREIVARSKELIEFLASMCALDKPLEGDATESVEVGMVANRYCLKPSHLLLAWKTCTSKADAAVSTEVYKLLVEILPSLPNDLAITLLKEIQKSLADRSEKRDYLFEVAEFCSALAVEKNKNSNDAMLPVISDEVRSEILELLWDVLTHQDASSLKNYEQLKEYVTHELRVEPMGTAHREKFLRSCCLALKAHAELTGSSGSGESVDEVLALRMVQLTRFVLQACPREQAAMLVTGNDATLAVLLLRELVAYLKRRAAAIAAQLVRKLSSVNGVESNHPAALSERLHIIRYVYGLSDRVVMNGQQLDLLWGLCAGPGDREALMVFIANASTADSFGVVGGGGMENASVQPNKGIATPVGGVQQKQPLSSAFSDDVSLYAFQHLFCASNIDWEHLGEGAYQSFQKLFKSLSKSIRSSLTSNGPALDALWRICLSAGNDDVASQAMKDLLVVYSAIAQRPAARSDLHTESADAVTQTERTEESFVRRIFQCLVKVKGGLESGDPSSERSAERCVRILNAAVGHSNGGGGKTSSSAIAATLEAISVSGNIAEVLRSVPHGMRGQGGYRTIGIMAKRAPQTAVANSVGVPQLSSTSTATQIGPGKLPSSERFSLNVHPLETLGSVKAKVAKHCNHDISLVKPLTVSGRGVSYSLRSNGEPGQANLNQESEESVVAQLGITEGCEIVFLLASQKLPDHTPAPSAKLSSKKGHGLDLSEIFVGDGSRDSADRFFDTLLSVLEALPVRAVVDSGDSSVQSVDAHKLVWDLLLSMPSNRGIVDRVRSSAGRNAPERMRDGEGMVLDAPRGDAVWSTLLDIRCFHRSVYIMQVIDSFLQPSQEILSILPREKFVTLSDVMKSDAVAFRQGFIESGGFDAVMKFFISSGRDSGERRKKTQMGSAVALRILKCCFFGESSFMDKSSSSLSLDNAGEHLLESLSDSRALMKRLTSVVAAEEGVSDAAVLDVLQLLRLLFTSNPRMVTDLFSSLSSRKSEKFLMVLLLWESGGPVTAATVSAGSKIRKGMEDLILMIPQFAQCALPWLIKAMDKVEVGSDSTDEFFSVLRKLVDGHHGQVDGRGVAVSIPSESQLRDLGTAVCGKLASHPRPTSDNIMIDFSTGVLCGCLRLVRALIEKGGGPAFSDGIVILSKAVKAPLWSQLTKAQRSRGMFNVPPTSFRPRRDDLPLIDLMGVMFDGFLSCAETSLSTSICCDKQSRQLGFDVITAAARASSGGDGYLALVARISTITSAAAPSLRHRWGQNIASDERGNNRSLNMASKYSGLRNQGCTCYMNSVLQQLFMMPRLRENLCSATLPSSLRSSGSATMANGSDLVGKKISLHWDSGVSYDAMVEGYDESTGMHTIRYLPLQIAAVGGPQMPHHQAPQIHPEDIAVLPDELPEEFFLHEGRPGKETGAFEIVTNDGMDVSSEDGASGSAGESSGERRASAVSGSSGIKETEDEASSRRLLEEVQRTFVHLDESSRGRCFDPRSLVEASGCLKLEFDVWQQNDASEFAMKLLDRLEVSLKKWSPLHFKYLERTFGIKQTKQKICKECGLKTNREEHLMNIDCQIRGKTDVHEALDTMCEVEFMEGDNRVFCDRCKKKRDTVLRTAISALPDVLVLSLKRFDLDYNTFETVKLNSRCAFGQTLNMKKYTLEGVEAREKASVGEQNGDSDSMMDTTEDGETSDPLSTLPDEDYEYNLAGVLVHAGVAQGGHYYSFIKDRFSPNGEGADKWYRFDDEDVTQFDPSSIEVECFGGKVKKETKWPNGQVHTVESEQFANALMLFYEKVKPAKFEGSEKDEEEEGDAPMDEESKMDVPMTSGYDVFQQDVRRSNKIHSWHNFLFDTEFLYFLKGLLDLCITSPDGSCGGDTMEPSTPLSSPMLASQPAQDSDTPWRMALLDLSFSYFFGILLHSVEKDTLSAWTDGLKAALECNRVGAKLFTRELARRTHEVSTNWLRVFCSDCPEETSREAAIKVFATAVQICAGFPEEQAALDHWIKAWRLQVEEREKEVLAARGVRQQVSTMPMPTKLQGAFKVREDLNGLEGGSSSSLGVIVSFLTTLLEVAPRSWRYNSDLCLLLRELASLDASLGGQRLRNAMMEAQIPARLISLAIRERSPFHMRAAFPGASVSLEIADAMLKAETTPSSHLLPLAGGAVGGAVSSSGGNSSMPNPSDYLHLLEALGRIIGIQHVKQIPIISETGDFSKGRAVVDLSREAKEALTEIFNESMTAAAGGMSHNDVLKYMRQCGIEASNINAQKVSNILAKYATTGGIESGKEARFLTLEGFLDYYRDNTQSNDAQQAFSDLNAFGFRPDLTRRAEQCRRYASGDSQKWYQPAESIALDVFSSTEQKPRRIGKLAEMGLACFNFYTQAYSTNEVISEYILAYFCLLGRDTTRLINESLKALNRAQSGWAGTEITSACLMAFRILAAVPDERQKDRITTLMQCNEKAHAHSDIGVGLLIASKDMVRHSQHFQHGALDRYVNTVKQLRRQREVKKWMSENESLWGWMDQWLRPDSGQHQMRGDYIGRHDGIHPPSAPLNHHHLHSDSDMNASEDDDSRYDQDSSLEEGRIVVDGAGVSAVDGMYTRDGIFDHIPKYSKAGVWNNEEQIFSLFRCKLSDGTRRWYISIVPKGVQPGTNRDIDFYSAPIVTENSRYPPENKWTPAKSQGVGPPPVVYWKSDNIPETEDQVDGEGRFVDGENTMDEEGDDGQNALGYL
eukprot:CAMPEP_0197442408 /NCGR_PEP_ID=MMETSP1175-20131217/8425_1 /TAXON_ID=1003142 /ORGANISM="Triceratium dubium, Strain CCMP147" /LENGTH=3192 /DNA_ID=CAMNT_0042972873 /DNA_START=42 /DNA_END=9620 /DNA_ORIENTATION=-